MKDNDLFSTMDAPCSSTRQTDSVIKSESSAASMQRVDTNRVVVESLDFVNSPMNIDKLQNCLDMIVSPPQTCLLLCPFLSTAQADDTALCDLPAELFFQNREGPKDNRMICWNESKKTAIDRAASKWLSSCKEVAVNGTSSDNGDELWYIDEPKSHDKEDISELPENKPEQPVCLKILGPLTFSNESDHKQKSHKKLIGVKLVRPTENIGYSKRKLTNQKVAAVNGEIDAESPVYCYICARIGLSDSMRLCSACQNWFHKTCDETPAQVRNNDKGIKPSEKALGSDPKRSKHVKWRCETCYKKNLRGTVPLLKSPIKAKLSDKLFVRDKHTKKPLSVVKRLMKPCIVCHAVDLDFSTSIYCSDRCIDKAVKEVLDIVQMHTNLSKNDNYRVTLIDKMEPRRVAANNAAPLLKNLTKYLRTHRRFYPADLLRPSLEGSSSKVNESEAKAVSTKPKVEAAPSVASIVTSSNAQPVLANHAKVDHVRLSVRQLFHGCLLERMKNCDDILLSKDEVKALAIEIEREMYKAYNGEVQGAAYKQQCKLLLTHLKDPQNEAFFRRILNGTLSPSKVASMGGEEMASKDNAAATLSASDKAPDSATCAAVVPLDLSYDVLNGETTTAPSIQNELLRQAAVNQAAKSLENEVASSSAAEVSSESLTTGSIDNASHKKPVSGDKRPKLPSKRRLEGDQVIARDTTPLHKSHLFDLNCKICTGAKLQQSTFRIVTSNAAATAQSSQSASENSRESLAKTPRRFLESPLPAGTAAESTGAFAQHRSQDHELPPLPSNSHAFQSFHPIFAIPTHMSPEINAESPSGAALKPFNPAPAPEPFETLTRAAFVSDHTYNPRAFEATTTLPRQHWRIEPLPLALSQALAFERSLNNGLTRYSPGGNRFPVPSTAGAGDGRFIDAAAASWRLRDADASPLLEPARRPADGPVERRSGAGERSTDAFREPVGRPPREAPAERFRASAAPKIFVGPTTPPEKRIRDAPVPERHSPERPIRHRAATPAAMSPMVTRVGFTGAFRAMPPTFPAPFGRPVLLSPPTPAFAHDLSPPPNVPFRLSDESVASLSYVAKRQIAVVRPAAAAPPPNAPDSWRPLGPRVAPSSCEYASSAGGGDDSAKGASFLLKNRLIEPGSGGDVGASTSNAHFDSQHTFGQDGNNYDLSLRCTNRGAKTSSSELPLPPRPPDYQPEHEVFENPASPTKSEGSGNVEPSPPLIEEYVWRGLLEMPTFYRFNAAFVGVSGPVELLSRDLPNHLKVVGRIPRDDVMEYVRNLKGNATKDVVVIRVAEPPDLEQKAQYHGLFSNMMQRGRFGVIDTLKLPKIKDLYLMPLADNEEPDPILLPFDGHACLPSPRTDLILAIVVRRKDRMDMEKMDQRSV